MASKLENNYWGYVYDSYMVWLGSNHPECLLILTAYLNWEAGI